MDNSKKKGISENLRAYVSRYPSQNKAVNSLKGVSAATVSCILNEKWDLISDDMWMNIQSQIAANKGWQLYGTVAFSLSVSTSRTARMRATWYGLRVLQA